MFRPAVALLSKENLIHNINVVKNRVGKSKIVAMIKANAYGHGIQSTGKILDNHVDMFGVASIDEALQLRNNGVKSPILLAQGMFRQKQLSFLAKQNFHVTFHNKNHIKWLMENQVSSPINIWLKINTGLSRLGFDLQTANDVYNKLRNHPKIASIKIMTHFACSNDKDHPMNKSQMDKFHEFTKDKQNELSICNSGAIINFPHLHYNYVRPGLIIYGVSPVDGVPAKELGIKPVMTLKTQLMSIYNMPKGSYVGYGSTYQCDQDMVVGIAAFGYGDGYSVSTKPNTPILVNNVRCRVIGRVSMDMIAIDLRSQPNAEIGDSVTLWGDNLPIQQVAENTSDSTYKLLTGVTKRVQYVWQ